jgi:hypothetical protein
MYGSDYKVHDLRLEVCVCRQVYRQAEGLLLLMSFASITNIVLTNLVPFQYKQKHPSCPHSQQL